MERQTRLATRDLREEEKRGGSRHTNKDQGLERAKCKLSFPLSSNLFSTFSLMYKAQTHMDTQTFHSLIGSGVSHAVTDSSDKTKEDQSNPKPVWGGGGGGGGSSMKLEHKELVSLHLRPLHIQQLTVKVLTGSTSHNKNYESNHAKG